MKESKEQYILLSAYRNDLSFTDYKQAIINAIILCTHIDDITIMKDDTIIHRFYYTKDNVLVDQIDHTKER